MNQIDKFYDELFPFQKALIDAQRAYFDEWANLTESERDVAWKRYQDARNTYEKELANFQSQ